MTGSCACCGLKGRSPPKLPGWYAVPLIHADSEMHADLPLYHASSYWTSSESPSVEVAFALADFSDVSMDYLVGRSDDPRRN